MSLPFANVVRMLACASLCAVPVHAQQVRAVAGLGVLVKPDQEGPGSADEDPGERVTMFENPSLDNYLDRAQMFLGRDDYAAAIKVLQDVVDGRTLEVFAVASDGENPDAPEGGGESETNKPADRPKGAKPAKQSKGVDNSDLTASNAVFSRDGRLYRPVRRLCHELLAKMPDVGVQIYRTEYEHVAEELLQEAIASGSELTLEEVSNRYFITLPSGRAMMLLADRRMQQGRYRACVQVLRDLLQVYPAQNRKALGIREDWCRFKIALCLRLAGEVDGARKEIQELADAYPEASLRISGQLERISTMPQSELFAREMVSTTDQAISSRKSTWLQDEDLELIPIWQHRFRNEDPYKNPKPRRSRGQVWIDSGGKTLKMPYPNRYGPGTHVSFVRADDVADAPMQAVFLEHFRLRIADAPSGLMLAEGDGALEPPVARETHPRVRIAASDYALLRTVEDDLHRYVILGHQASTTTSTSVLKKSTLVAYSRKSGNREWTSEEWLDGPDGFRDVTFLAAPTVFGTRLLLPSLRQGAYTLECVDAASGKPIWHTRLHADGSPFFKAPGCLVAVQGGVAFVATNAGCLAAVDALVGDLRWIRRYERYDAVHSVLKKKKTSGNRRVFSRSSGNFQPASLPSFIPSDLILHKSLVVLAPCDSQLVLAIEATTGELAWLLDGRSIYAPYGRLTEIVGHNHQSLFALSRTHLVCIDLDGGLVRWSQPLPSWSGEKFSGRGRGLVAGDTVVVPNSREILLFDGANAKPVRRLPLPTFGASKEPLSGSSHLFIDGPYLAVGYRNGVEVFSTQSALRGLAKDTEDPLRRSSYLMMCGDREEAERVLMGVIEKSQDDALRRRATGQLLGCVTQRAGALARAGDLVAALAVMDDASEYVTERRDRLNWHLGRIELCNIAGDMSVHEHEQQSLYNYMEGR